MKKSVIRKLDKKGLCIGCGLCEAICGAENVNMVLLKDGFYHPNIKSIRKESELIIKNICPGLNIVNDIIFSKNERIWGKIECLFTGFSTDTEIREKGSSGGIGSAIANYLIKKKIIDAALQVGGNDSNYLNNTLRISKTRDDILKCASSRYAPALIFNRIFEFLKKKGGHYCFIGKPCDISALKNLLKEFPQYRKKIVLTVGIMCAGMPSFNATDKLINDCNPATPIKALKYRGDGWPGNFSFIDRNGKKFEISYQDSWGGVLGKHIHQRCKICPDAIGLQADIVIGDAWETVDGYPNFSERNGRSLIIVRTEKGLSFINKMNKDKAIKINSLPISKIKFMQPYQYKRRKYVGARVLAYTFAKGKILNFKNLLLSHNAIRENSFSVFKEFIGSFKRFISKNY